MELARPPGSCRSRRRGGVYNAVLKRYWYHAWWFYAHSIACGGIGKVHIGLEIKAAG
jgi:hypothetical protein